MNIGESVEDSCRRLIRVLPADYRAAHGEDLVSTLADTVDERGVLPLRERLAVLALAVRLRVVTPVTGPAAAALVAMLVLVQAGLALLGVLMGTVSALLYLGQAWLPVPRSDLPLAFDLGSELASQIGQDLVFAAGWLAVLYGLLHGRRFAAPVAVALAGVPLVFQVINNPYGLAWASRVLTLCTLVAALYVWRRGPLSVPGRPGRWLLALLVSTAWLLAQAQLLAWLPLGFAAPVIWALGAVAVVVVVLVAKGRPWLLLAGSWLALLVALSHGATSLIFDFSPPVPQLSVALAVAVVLAGLAWLSPAGAVRRVARR
ncbi:MULTISPECIES: hypothetical protein [unclassified Crossiella]|uniref:hypothetical protein n=1 Tax=unclassified Crossiella TaxID=2620835 RepID=UPI001FFF6816|nr:MULTISPECIES: hypothetical protein [unclassified Crossiella]MCK2239655.1 hypothetical protein [Crossiella sp. S99.2]MCK2252350.1 hypothetical protein [Crossiella sp. S99.1]